MSNKTIIFIAFTVFAFIAYIPSVQCCIGGGGSGTNIGSYIGPCWDTWSRCTKWSSSGTGILWQSCNNRCICKGKASGTCKLVPSNCPLSNKAYQCQCSGTRSGPKPNWCGF